MTISGIVLNRLAEYASQKEWPGKRLTQQEIFDILLSKPPTIGLKYDKIDFALVEIKRLQDPRYINIITARKIAKTNKKLEKFHFDDRLRLCCPKDTDSMWKEALKYYSSLHKDDTSDDFSDEFEWATDESGSIEDSDCWDYIVPDIRTTKNIVKDFFF